MVGCEVRVSGQGDFLDSGLKIGILGSRNRDTSGLGQRSLLLRYCGQWAVNWDSRAKEQGHTWTGTTEFVAEILWIVG